MSGTKFGKWWSCVKLRREILKEIRFKIEIEHLRLAACQLELSRIDSMQYKAYSIMWKQMLDHYQEILILKYKTRGMNLFWVITGKKLNIVGKIKSFSA